MKRIISSLLLVISILFIFNPNSAEAGTQNPTSRPAALNPNPPSAPVKLIFIHHSTGEAWLGDYHGQLGLQLMNNNYFVSDTNYGWGSDSIGSVTDIGDWYSWFRGPNSATYTSEIYQESAQHAGYTRLETDPGGENQIIMFKSCFPNSGLQGSPSDLVPAIEDNPLRGQGAWSGDHTVANAKGIYIDLLNYFQTQPNKLFVVITAPPLSDGAYADNARAFNNWLVDEWLVGYPYKNVAVFDFYTVLTSNGGDSDTNDLNASGGNHHRYTGTTIEHLTTGGGNTLAYPSVDDHPSAAGDLKASAEFLPLLNIFYHAWKDSLVLNVHFFLPLVTR